MEKELKIAKKALAKITTLRLQDPDGWNVVEAWDQAASIAKKALIEIENANSTTKKYLP